MIIRKARVVDIEALQAIAKQTFIETFAEDNLNQHLQSYIQNAFSLEQLRSELKNSLSHFYLALSGDQIAGYLKLNFGTAQTEIRDEVGIEIERIYVLKRYQGKQVGRMMLENAIAVAQEHKAHYIWLGVWEKNVKAIQFYTKNGFIEFDKHLFMLGDEAQTDIMMKHELQE